MNLCDKAMAQAMNEVAVDSPSDISETETVGLETCAAIDEDASVPLNEWPPAAMTRYQPSLCIHQFT